MRHANYLMGLRKCTSIYFHKNMGADICLIIKTGAYLGDGGDLYDIWETIQPWVNEYRVYFFNLIVVIIFSINPLSPEVPDQAFFV